MRGDDHLVGLLPAGDLADRVQRQQVAGVGVEDDGTQRYLDITAAYRQACLNAIEYLKKFGYTDEQAYIIIGWTAQYLRDSGLDAATAGFRVGYEDPSYFSRDYKKQFGAPPQRDIAMIREGLSA